ncbi:MAG: class I tRNA ligase family protein, partial [Pseudomonadota bacterium]
LDWTEAGIDGAWRFVNRMWRTTQAALPLMSGIGMPQPADLAESGDESTVQVFRDLQKTIAGVTEDLEKFHYNRAVARIREFFNLLAGFTATGDIASWVRRNAFETLAILTAPMMPHLAEEMWSALGHSTLAVESPWPKADPAFLQDDVITLAVQVNGKVRGNIRIPADSEQAVAQEAAKNEASIAKFLVEKQIRRVIYVPNRILNIVVG